MKICIFCHDAYMSGATLALYDWISSDKFNNYMIVLPHENQDSLFYNLKNVEVISGNYFVIVKELKKTSSIHKIKKFFKLLYNFVFGKMNRKKMEKIIRNWKTDIIISNSFVLLEGIKISIDLGIPHIWHIREFMKDDHQIEHYSNQKIKSLTEKSNAIFISKAIEKYYLKKYNFLSSKVIYDQVREPLHESIRNEYFANGIIKIMIAGILQENKGQLEAIKIAEQIKKEGYDVKLDIYGEGDNYDQLKKYIENNKIDYIEFKGFCQNLSEKRSQYDISLVCSKNEAFGRVTIESMLAKNITIAANAGASNELIVNNKTGYLYSLGDIKGCSNLIIKIYNNKENVYDIVENAYNFAREYYCKPIYNQIISYINQECLR